MRSALGAVVLVLACLSAGCSSAGSDGPGPITDPPSRPVVLGHGAVAGRPWTLTASASGNRNLCLGVNEATPDDPLSTAGCGFGPLDPPEHWRDTDPILSTADSAGHALYFGPAPAGSVRVRLDSFALDATPPADSSALAVPGCTAAAPSHVYADVTRRLPHWAGDGGWFVTAVPEPDGTCGYRLGAFLDRDGHRVANHRW